MTDRLEHEWQRMLHRAFVLARADHILVDGWSSPHQRQAMQAAVDAGWLYTAMHEGDQYTAIIGKLSEKGKAALFDQVAA